MRRRRWSVVPAAAMIAGLTGCGTGLTGRPAQPEAAPSPLPGDQVVFMVEAIAGFVPPIVIAFGGPSLAMYGDGRVIEFAPGERPYDVPPTYEVARVNPNSVAQFAAEAEAAGVVDEATDFGSPQVTDLPVTVVTLHGVQTEREVRVYAFAEEFAKDLSAAQASNRRRLGELIDQAESLPGDIARDPYTPEQVQVSELDPKSADTRDDPPWPGPDPKSFITETQAGSVQIGCGSLSGTDADSVYRAAQDNQGAAWVVDGKRRILAVLPLLPGEEACPS